MDLTKLFWYKSFIKDLLLAYFFFHYTASVIYFQYKMSYFSYRNIIIDNNKFCHHLWKSSFPQEKCHFLPKECKTLHQVFINIYDNNFHSKHFNVCCCTYIFGIFTYYVYLFWLHTVVNIMPFYAIDIQVRGLASYKTMFNPLFSA